MLEYKVIQKKRAGAFKSFEPEHLEKLLNEMAAEGWEFDRVVDIQSFTKRDTFWVVFKRKKGSQEYV